MGKFPKPLTPPKSVEDARKSRGSALKKSVMLGIGARALVVFLELGAFFLFGSRALLMDALSTLLDIASSLVLFIFIKLADRPPDANHPLGHGRYEPLAGMQLGVFLASIGIYMGINNLIDLTAQHEGFSLPPFLFAVPLFAIVLLELSYRYLMHVAKNENSSALVSEAAHFRVDAITSIVAMFSLGIGQFFPSVAHLFDNIGAILISGVMVFLGLSAAWQNTRQLLDTKPEKKFFTKVKKAAMKAKGVKGTEKINIQQYGPDAHVNIDIEVDPKLTVEEAHRISQRVRVEIQKEWPSVQDVIVHVEPYYPKDH